MFLYKRRGIFYLAYHEKESNRDVRVSTHCTTKPDALKFVSDFKEELRNRTANETIPISLGDFVKSYLDYSRTVHTSKSTETIDATFRVFQRFTGNIMLSDFGTRIIDGYIAQRIKTVSPYSARRDFANLSAAFNWAITKRFLLSNPCKGLKRIRLPEKLPLFFSPEEFESLLAVIQEKELRQLVEFAVQTGLRQGELLGLTWQQVNLEEKLLILDNRSHVTKSKKVRAVPLNPKALAILNERKDAAGDLIFTLRGRPIDPDFLSHRFKEYVRSCGINHDLHFHSLRHTFASWLVQRGVPIVTVKELLGHRDLSTTMIYSHVRREDLVNAVKVLEG